MLFFVPYRCKIKFGSPLNTDQGSIFNGFFRWIITLLICWILSMLLNFDFFLSRNSTGRRYVDGSEFLVKLWPGSKFNWDPTAGHNSTCYHLILGVTFQRWIKTRVTFHDGSMTQGCNSTLNHDLRSQFQVKSYHGVHIHRLVCELWTFLSA